MAGLDRLFDACVAVTPPLTDEALKRIPAKRGVFGLLAADDRPILVTTAADIRSRLRYRLTAPEPDRRRKAADLREITAKVCWKLTHSRFETDWRYLQTVQAVWPDTYTDLLPKRFAWFIAVDPSEPIPVFTVEAGVTGRGRHFGPFRDRRSADAFIDGLTDVFDLCRCVSILRQAPAGSACAYKQMGRCAAPCDGSAPIADYRDLVRRAAEFAAGEHDAQRELLTKQMQEASDAMQFEAAGVLKSRLGRLDELTGPRHVHVGDAQEFRFVIIQRGPSSHQACTFVCDQGVLAAGPIVEFPPVESRMVEVLSACDRLADTRRRGPTEADCRRMGLVSWYLFSTKAEDGLLLHRRSLTPPAVAEAVAGAADALRLRPPAKRSPKAAKPADTENG